MNIYTVTGCIAAGKSTLAKKIADFLSCKLLTEDCDSNPYLAKYYEDMRQYAYHMQMWYLNSRISQLMRNINATCVVQDQMIQAFGYIFPSMQRKEKLLSDVEYQALLATLNKFYEQDKVFSTVDETVFYLRVQQHNVPTILERIKLERGRDYESGITEEYMKCLIEAYERWFENALVASTRKVVVLDAFDSVEDNMKRVMSSLS